MKKIKISLMLLIIIGLLSGCAKVTVTKEKYTDGSKNVTDRTVEVKSNIEIPEDGIYKVYQYLEDNTYYIFTESRMGNAINSAYQVLKDGTKKAIDNVNNFLLDENIAHVELDLEPGVPVEGIQLSSKTYTGIFLGNKIKTQLNYTVLPKEASNQNVKFFSSDTDVLKVDGRGNITILGPGTATVTVITLEGGYKQMCLFKIEEGTKALKNTIEFDDYESNALVDTRYDDPSSQESQFNHVTKTPDGNIILAAGTRTKSQNQYAGIVYFGMQSSNDVSGGTIAEIDSENKMFSVSLESIAHSDDDNSIYTVGYALDKVGSKHSGLISKLFIVKTGIGERIEPKGYEIIGNTKEFYTEFYSIVSVGDYLYVAGREFDDPGLGFQTDKTRFSRSYIYKFDKDLNKVEKTEIPDLRRISRIGYNEDSDVLYFAGEDDNGNGVVGEYLYNTDKSLRLGKTSITSDIKINDIIQIAEDSYAVVGETIIKGKVVGNVQTFSLNNDKTKLHSNNISRELHDDVYELSYFKSILYNDGIISILGYAEPYEKKTKWYKPSTWFGDKAKYGYAMVVSFDVNLNYISGFKYFNGQKDHGKKQVFNSAVITNSGTITAVGYSNYGDKENLNNWNGYIQYDVSLLGIEVNADYPDMD